MIIKMIKLRKNIRNNALCRRKTNVKVRTKAKTKKRSRRSPNLSGNSMR